MAVKEQSIKDRFIEINLKLGQIPCLNLDNKGVCHLHREIRHDLSIVVKMLEANHIELTDLRQGMAIIMEEHGIPCDEISGWDIKTYRRDKDVRGQGIQGSEDINTDDLHGKGSSIKRKKQTPKIRRAIRKAERKRRKEKHVSSRPDRTG